jgi:hypothetical protein
MYGFMADLVLIVHLAFIVFVIAGGFVVWWWPRLIIAHLTVVIWGLAVEFVPFLTCPLTPLEQILLRKAGEKGYEGGFVNHYLIPLIYPDAPPSFFLEVGFFVLAINGIIYAFIIRGMTKKKGTGKK